VQSGTQEWVATELRDRLDVAGAPSDLAVHALAEPPIVPLPSEGPQSLTTIARAAARHAERTALKHVLDRVHWNRREAARQLKVSYKTLRRKIDECGLED
jgi:DNA-binding NtrC family response regulator